MPVNSLSISGISAHPLIGASGSYQYSIGVGSNGYISGKTLEVGLPVSRRVMCYHRKSGVLVGSVLSGIDGYYRIPNLIAGIKYFVTSVDESNDAVQYNAVTQDLITASEVTT